LFVESLRLAGVHHNVNLVAGFSPQAVEELASKFNKKWSLFFIDGNHNGEYPLNVRSSLCFCSCISLFARFLNPHCIYFDKRMPEYVVSTVKMML
jgi:hypothetical protein